MGTPNLTLTPGDILRGIVECVDPALDACIINAGTYGQVMAPLSDCDAAAVSRLSKGDPVCAQLISLGRGKELPRASLRVEFSGRTSVLVMDGTCFFNNVEPSVQIYVSPKLAGVRRAELAGKLQDALANESCGLSAMLDAVYGPVTLILRTAADTVEWDKVLNALVVQATEAAALATIANMSSVPALLMAEKPDADGDVTLATSGGLRGNAPELLDGKKLILSDGGEVIFEHTHAFWSICVMPAGSKSGIDACCPEAATAIGEALSEYNVHGLSVLAFPAGVGEDAWQKVLQNLGETLSLDNTQIMEQRDLACICINLA